MLAIRDAALADIPSVSALLAETWHATYDAIYGADRVAELTRRWHAADALASGLDRPDTCFLVAVDGGEIVGTLSVVSRADGVLDLKRLYVLPRVQGSGIGGQLLEAGLSAFPEAHTITLEVEPANGQAIRFYERKGFQVTGRTGDCSGSGDRIPALVMSRVLEPGRRHARALAADAVSSDG
jgi:ribosomal protein S18 acetylase RimI-like enzyme